MPLTRRAALAGILSLMSHAAWAAHGTTPLKVVEEIDINAPPSEVWAVVANFQRWSWLPGVVRITGSGDAIPDQGKHELTLENGAAIEESLTKLDTERLSLGFHMDRVDVKILPVTNYSGVVTVRPGESGTSIVEWKARFYRGYPNNNPPPELNDEVAIAAVTARHKAALAALKAKIEGK